MSVASPQISTAEYVGLDPSEYDYQPDVLAPRMSDFELDYLLSSTNNELKCAILGLMSTVPHSKDEIFDEFVKRGGTKVQPLRRTDIIRGGIDRFPHAFIARNDNQAWLTPYGLTAQAIAGHKVEISRTYGTALAILCGQSMRRKLFERDGAPVLAHLPRLAVLAHLGNTLPDDTTLVEVTDSLDHSVGMSRSAVRSILNAWGETELLDIKKVNRRQTALTINPDLGLISRAFGELIIHSYNRDESYFQSGREKLRAVLDVPSELAMLVRRSVISTGREIPPKLMEVEQGAYDAINIAGRPLLIGELLQFLPAYKNRDPRALGWMLNKIAKFPDLRLRVVGTEKRNAKLWGIKSS